MAARTKSEAVRQDVQDAMSKIDSAIEALSDGSAVQLLPTTHILQTGRLLGAKSILADVFRINEAAAVAEQAPA